MKIKGFELLDTGGGCTALARRMNGHDILVTGAYTGMAPTNYLALNIAVYDPTGAVIFDFNTYTRASFTEKLADAIDAIPAEKGTA